jgi:CubicO group peptidase (beta-lactamase class C family)
MEARRIAGAVVVVVHGGQVVFAEGFGDADVATGRAMTPETPLRIGSITKLLTALAAMQLVETGQLDLDREVNDYLDVTIPQADSSPITMRRLLSHRTGLEDRRGGIGAWSGDRPALGPFLARHLPPRLVQNPDVIAYANVNATLAAYAVERASGERFESYLETHIFERLGLTHTTARQPLPGHLQSVVASGYVRSDLPPTPVSMAAATIYEVGSTGVVASGADMGRLMLAFLEDEPRVVSRASLDAMMTSQTRVGRGTIGLGLYSPLAAGGNAFIGHDGDTGGFHSTLALLPERTFGVFAAYNSDGLPNALSPAAELLQQMSDRFFADAAIVSAAMPGGDISGTYQPARRVDSNLFTLRSLFEQLTIGRAARAPTIRPAMLPFGTPMDETGPNRFRWAGREVSFVQNGSSVAMQVGAPVAQLVQVSWWQSAGIVLPVVLTSLIVAAAAVIVWAVGVLRRGAGVADVPSRRLRAATRSALLLHVVAIGSAFWLVLWGWPLVAISSPVVSPVALGIYAAAWTATALTPVVLWHCTRLVSTSPGLGPAIRESLLALIVVVLTAFSLLWRVAGTTLAF